MKNLKIYFAIIISVLTISSVKAQQANTLFFMDRVFQSQTVNVAAISPHKTQVSGLIIPVFGQLPPNMYLNYANNSFNYNHLIHHGEGVNADSLVLDIPLFMKKLRKTTNIHGEFRIDYFNLALRSKNNQSEITITLADRFQFGTSLPYDMFDFLINGNLGYMNEGKAHNLSKLATNVTAFRELGVGFAMRMSDKVSIGGRVKVLFGLADISTNVNKLVVNTNPDSYFLDVDADLSIRKSLSLIDFDIKGDSLSTKTYFDDQDKLIKTALCFTNPGFGLDFGVQYHINNKISTFASVTDLGFMCWTNGAQTAKAEGSYTFEGVELGFYEDEDGNMKYGIDPNGRYSTEHIADTLVQLFDMELEDKTYTSMLSSNFYVGATYKLHDKISLGLLYHGEIYKRTYMQSITVSANSDLNHWLSLHLSYSYMNNSLSNVGFGFSIRAAFMTWYMVSDDVIGMIWPQKAKGINFRMGCNLTFGHPKKVLVTSSRL